MPKASPPDPTPSDVLTLSDLEGAIRPTVNFGGERHPFRLIEEFSIDEHHRFQAEFDEYNELWGRPTLNSKQRKRLEDLTERLFSQSLVNAGELTGRLSGAQKRSVILTFPVAPALAEAMAQQETETETEQTTESSGSES